MTRRIAAVIVTYNRRALLSRCLRALYAQSCKPDMIVVVDNFSTDGTRQMLADEAWLTRDDLVLIALPSNTGGAGGFAAGISYAAALDVDWIWIMDDDAVPHPDALERLAPHLVEPMNLYGSVAVAGDQLAWPMSPLGQIREGKIRVVSDLPPIGEVQFIPFLGLAISRPMVEAIGLPDAGFFIAADDVDYCLRAREQGAQVMLVGDSRIEHPSPDAYRLRFPWGDFFNLRLAPWKRYYDVRNRIFVARNHYGWRLWCKTLPGSVLRLVATLLHEPNRTQQLRAFVAGIVDGVLGRKGRRHEAWGIHA